MLIMVYWQPKLRLCLPLQMQVRTVKGTEAEHRNQHFLVPVLWERAARRFFLQVSLPFIFPLNKIKVWDVSWEPCSLLYKSSRIAMSCVGRPGFLKDLLLEDSRRVFCKGKESFPLQDCSIRMMKSIFLPGPERNIQDTVAECCKRVVQPRLAKFFECCNAPICSYRRSSLAAACRIVAFLQLCRVPTLACH